MEIFWTAFISLATGSGVTALANFFLHKKKSRAEATDVTVNAATKIVKLYGQAVSDLEARVEELTNEVSLLRVENKELKAEVRELKRENADLRLQ